MMICGCGCGGSPNAGKRFVHGHNSRMRQATPLDEIYVVEDRGYETPCWICKVASGDRYARIRFNGGTRSAHRTFYERDVGPIPAGLVLDHLCRVTACVNPTHLEPVTQAENLRRGAMSILTEDDVREIHRNQNVPRAELARRFGVSETTIYGVLVRRNWKDVEAA